MPANQEPSILRKLVESELMRLYDRSEAFFLLLEECDKMNELAREILYHFLLALPLTPSFSLRVIKELRKDVAVIGDGVSQIHT